MCVPQCWLSLGLIVVIFCGLEGSEESRWPTPSCGHKRGQLFLCLPVWAFSIIVQHKRASEVRWDEWSEGVLEWDGISLGSTLPGLGCWGQMEAANDSTVAGSTSQALVCVCSSTLSSLFSPSASLSVRNMFPAVWWELWNDGCLSGRGGASEERLVLSNPVYGSNTIIPPCDSLIEWLRSERECPLCVTSHIITL